ncbi:hypothetical protein L195_g064688, partial [Trifolium pratense]
TLRLPTGTLQGFAAAAANMRGGHN